MFKKQDPVCGAKVSKSSHYALEYAGKKYYFDCNACKNTFANNPHRFIPKKSGRGLLKWLVRGSEGVPGSCHEINE